MASEAARLELTLVEAGDILGLLAQGYRRYEVAELLQVHRNEIPGLLLANLEEAMGRAPTGAELLAAYRAKVGPRRAVPRPGTPHR